MSFSVQNGGPELRTVMRIKRKRQWVKRIVILEGGFLYYYKSSRDTKPRGILPLSSYAVRDLGVRKGEYVVELVGVDQAVFGLAFATQQEGVVWVEAIKGLKSDLRSRVSEENSPDSGFDEERIAKQFCLEPLPSLVFQKIRPILEKCYILVGCQGNSMRYEVIEEEPGKGESTWIPNTLGLIFLAVALLVFGSESLVFKASLVVALTGYIRSSFIGRKKLQRTEIAFKSTGVADRSVPEVLSVLLDIPGRGLWDPFCSESTEKEEISLTYTSPAGSIKQTITRTCYIHSKQYLLLERDHQALKYLFMLEAVDADKTRISVHGKCATPWMLQAANPDVLPCLLAYLHSSPKQITSLKQGSAEQMSGDEEEGVSSLPSASIVSEPSEGITRYQSESNEALSVFKQLLEETSGWEAISTGKTETKGSRRPAPGSLYIIRGEAVIRKPAEEVMAYLKDLSRKGEYDTMFESGYVLEAYSEDLEVVYQRYKRQFPASGRDLCLVQRRFQETNGTVYAVATSTTHPASPSNPDLVRAHLYIGGFALQPLEEASTRLVYMTHADLGGRLPTMIVNKVQNSQALVVEGVRRALNK